jgi:hypothetical protein
MWPENGKEGFIPTTRKCTRRVTRTFKIKTGNMSGRIDSGVKRPAGTIRLASLICNTGMVMMLGLILVNSAFAASPFDIDGAIPDAITDIFEADDPNGSVQELGPSNGSSTKLGTVHTALPPMLDFTNPNGQTDLVNIWLATDVDASNDIWLYFAWERVATSGSSVVTYEFQQADLGSACNYIGDEPNDGPVDFNLPQSKDETDLIDTCNPWSGRAPGDFMIVWDFKGGATDIVLRSFTSDGEFDVTVLAEDNPDAEAALSDDTSMGEGAINLSELVFPEDPAVCTSIANIITGTITGNSDSADYKDTVLADISGGFSISNCAQIIIRKNTEPPGAGGDFYFDHTLSLLPLSSETEFYMPHGSSRTMSVAAPTSAPGYTVTERLVPGFTLTEINCGDNHSPDSINSDKVNRNVTISLQRNETVDCTFTNTQDGTIIIRKQTLPDGIDQAFSFTGDPAGSIRDYSAFNEQISIDRQPGLFGGEETVPAGWALTDISCASVDNTSTVSIGVNDIFTSAGFDRGDDQIQVDLAAGDTVTCTYTNTKLGSITVEKQTTPDDSEQTFGFTGDASGTIADDETIVVNNLLPDTYTSTENVAGGWDLSSINCNDSDSSGNTTTATATFKLQAGENVKCTFNNAVQGGNIIVQKETDPDGSSQKFAFTTNYGSLGFELIDGQTNNSGNLLPSSEAGNYSVSETLLSGWNQTSATCTGTGNTPAAINLQPGETVTCTFNNRIQRGNIIVQKETDPDGSPQVFAFTTNYGSLGFNLTDGDVPNDSGPLLPSSEAGNYNVSETLPSGWNQTSATCTGTGNTPALINLQSGETVTCTFNNRIQRGKIIVDKVTVPGGSEQDFDFTADYDTAGFSLADGDVPNDSGPLLPSSEAGNYNVSETLPSGWNQTSATCTGAGNTPASINLQPGKTVTCTFTNTPKTGAIRIRKTRKYASASPDPKYPDPNAQPHDGVTFEISLGGTLIKSLITDDDGEACWDGFLFSGALVDDSTVGLYTVREIVPLGYVADGDPRGTPGKSDGLVTFPKLVDIDKEGDCASNEEIAAFSNTPLTNLTVTAASIDPGATKSMVECYEGSQDPTTKVITIGDSVEVEQASEDFADPKSVQLNNQLPLWPDDLIVCTIKIDP